MISRVMKLNVRLPRRKNSKRKRKEKGKEEKYTKKGPKCHKRQRRENLDLVEVANQANGRR